MNEVNELYLNHCFHIQKYCLIWMIFYVFITRTPLSDEAKNVKLSMIYRQNYSNYVHKVECLNVEPTLTSFFLIISD